MQPFLEDQTAAAIPLGGWYWPVLMQYYELIVSDL
jgi:hypothetical protein